MNDDRVKGISWSQNGDCIAAWCWDKSNVMKVLRVNDEKEFKIDHETEV